jgi:hypothetical protein
MKQKGDLIGGETNPLIAILNDIEPAGRPIMFAYMCALPDEFDKAGIPLDDACRVVVHLSAALTAMTDEDNWDDCMRFTFNRMNLPRKVVAAVLTVLRDSVELRRSEVTRRPGTAMALPFDNNLRAVPGF